MPSTNPSQKFNVCPNALKNPVRIQTSSVTVKVANTSIYPTYRYKSPLYLYHNVYSIWLTSASIFLYAPPQKTNIRVSTTQPGPGSQRTFHHNLHRECHLFLVYQSIQSRVETECHQRHVHWSDERHLNGLAGAYGVGGDLVMNMDERYWDTSDKRHVTGTRTSESEDVRNMFLLPNLVLSGILSVLTSHPATSLPHPGLCETPCYHYWSIHLRPSSNLVKTRNLQISMCYQLVLVVLVAVAD